MLVDLPGVQRPLDHLTERMQRRVERELSETDVALLVLNAEQGVGPGDRFIANALQGAPCPVVIAVNKVDRLDRPHIDRGAAGRRRARASATTSSRSARARARASSALAEHLFGLCPESPFLFDPAESTDLRPTSTSPS